MDKGEYYRLDAIRERASRRLGVIASGDTPEPGEVNKLRRTIAECESSMKRLKDDHDA
jgi:hypothetical protein